jgi:inosine-uridine nucleoside N-ribohydrolase
VAIGPLTNVAKFIQAYPEEYALLKEVVIMGGRFDTERAEWNIKCDPEAAEIVLSSDQKIRLVPLDVTLQCVFTEEQVERLHEGCVGNKRLSKMIDVWLANSKNRTMPILHDPLALASVFSDFCDFIPKKVKVLLEGEKRAWTVFDENGKEILVSLTVRAKEFTEFVCNSLCK